MSDETFLDRQLALVHALYGRTKEGRIDWHAHPDPRLFDADFGEFILRIRLIPDTDYPDEPDYSLEVWSADSDRLIETISNVTLRPVMDRITDDGFTPYTVLRETYEMARRQALNVDDALERILATLNRV